MESKPVMEFYKFILVLVLLIFLGLLSGYFLGSDNPVEQEIEKIIETETGYEVDLSP